MRAPPNRLLFPARAALQAGAVNLPCLTAVARRGPISGRAWADRRGSMGPRRTLSRDSRDWRVLCRSRRLSATGEIERTGLCMEFAVILLWGGEKTLAMEEGCSRVKHGSLGGTLKTSGLFMHCARKPRCVESERVQRLWEWRAIGQAPGGKAKIAHAYSLARSASLDTPAARSIARESSTSVEVVASSRPQFLPVKTVPIELHRPA